jgi:hypothetical protein
MNATGIDSRKKATGDSDLGQSPTVDILGHLLLQEPVSVGVPEQHYLHAADRPDGYRINGQ